MNNAYEYTGVVEVIGDTKTIGNKGFTKREIVVGKDVNDPSKWENPILFTLKKGNCAKADGLAKGMRVKVHFTIDGRKWDGPNGSLYFTDLTAWKVEVLNADGTVAAEPPTTPGAAATTVAPSEADMGDLPF